MRKQLLFFLLFCSACAAAQTKPFFFDRFYFSGWGGNLVYKTDRSTWKNIYADRGSIPYQLDKMMENYIFVDRLIPDINVKAGASISLAKRLTGSESKWWGKRELEWRTGINYKTSYYNPSQYGYLDTVYFPNDTTKINYRNFVRLQQDKQLLEWQNLLNFKTSSFPFKGMRFVIGNGFGISRTIKNTIKEDYSQTSYIWNTAQQLYQEQNTTEVKTDFKGKPETFFSYILYVATEYKPGPQITISVDFNYTLAHYKYSVKHPKAEGYWLGFTLGYLFPNNHLGDKKK